MKVVSSAPDAPRIFDIELTQGATVADALNACGLPPLATGEAVGVFGEIAGSYRTLANGERVEIYRPLIADPKESRRARATARRRQVRRETRGG